MGGGAVQFWLHPLRAGAASRLGGRLRRHGRSRIRQRASTRLNPWLDDVPVLPTPPTAVPPNRAPALMDRSQAFSARQAVDRRAEGMRAVRRSGRRRARLPRTVRAKPPSERSDTRFRGSASDAGGSREPSSVGNADAFKNRRLYPVPLIASGPVLTHAGDPHPLQGWHLSIATGGRLFGRLRGVAAVRGGVRMARGRGPSRAAGGVLVLRLQERRRRGAMLPGSTSTPALAPRS